VENLATWIDLAEQVVVVDSFSTDGTVDYLKKNLRHPQIRFMEHPPGLYASWNYGISQVTSEFCYISTVGDSITRAGIEHLVAAASRLNCDVLVSRPDFVNEAGKHCAGPDWPMDGVIKRLEFHEPTLLSSAIIIATAWPIPAEPLRVVARVIYSARYAPKTSFPWTSAWLAMAHGACRMPAASIGQQPRKR